MDEDIRIYSFDRLADSLASRPEEDRYSEKLPEENEKAPTVSVHRKKDLLYPVLALCASIAVALLIGTLLTQSRLVKTNDELVRVSAEISRLTHEQKKLKSEYAAVLSPEALESSASEQGMTSLSGDRIVSVSGESDRAEVLNTRNRQFSFRDLFDSIAGIFHK